MGDKSRRWDGEPETKADKKFFDLRASGYKGPIDRDGNKAGDPKGVFKALDKASKDRKAGK